jgi:hypothetical protein
MDCHTFAERYSIGLTYQADGSCTVRVTDLVTWQHKEANVDAPTEALVHLLAADLYPELLLAPVSPATIERIEGYRDGGSIGMTYCAHNKDPFEFFLPVAFNEDRSIRRHKPPVLFYVHVNTRRVAYNFTWQDAEQFLSAIKSDEPGLPELIEIVSCRGRCI